MSGYCWGMAKVGLSYEEGKVRVAVGLGFDRIDLRLDTPCECVLFLCVFGSAEEESEDGEGAIDKEDFETEFVAPKEFD